MTALELVKLPPLMEQTSGRPEVAIGLIDGPVAKDHPDFERQNIRELPGREGVLALSWAAPPWTMRRSKA